MKKQNFTLIELLVVVCSQICKFLFCYLSLLFKFTGELFLSDKIHSALYILYNIFVASVVIM